MTSLALVGSSLAIGMSDPEATSLDMHVSAAVQGLDDAGVEARDVDGLVTFGSFTMPHSTQVLTVADRLGLRGLRYAECIQVGGASAVAALNRIRALVAGGVCSTVVVVAADNQRSGLASSGALGAMFGNRHPLFEQPYGPTTAALYAIRATRYLHDHRVSPSMLSHAVTRSRESAIHAGFLPESDRCTFEEVERSRLVSSPLRLLHCSKVSDGAAAVIARAAAGSPGEVRLLGAGEHHRSGYFVHGAESGHVGAGMAADLAFREAGVAVADVRQAYVYDAFASSIGQTIEELGFADPGTAYGELRDGAFAWDGRVTINPHGGLLSLGNPGYPSGLYHVAAAVGDLRAGRVAAHADVALVHGSGGVMSSQAVALLERPR